jgi:hypothetical protein
MVISLKMTHIFDQFRSHHIDIEEMCNAGFATLAYYYFDFRGIEKENRKGLPSSLLSRLGAESDSYCDIRSRFRPSRASRARKPT